MQIRSHFRWFACSSLVLLVSAHTYTQAPSLNDQLLDAVGKGDVPAATALLKKGADPDAMFEARTTTALYVAAELKNAALVKLLLDHGADPDTRDSEWGRTPLRLASLPGDNVKATEATAEMLAALLEKGAGSEGESLTDLIRGGRFDAVRTIVNRGKVDPSYLNNALNTARRVQNWSLVDFLIEKGAKDPGHEDSARSPERLKRIAGVYRSAAGQQFMLRLIGEGDQLLLERPGAPSATVVPLDLMVLRSLDHTVALKRKAGPLPPPELTLTTKGRSETYRRTGDAPAMTTAAPPTRPAPQERRVAAAPASVAAASRTREWPSFRGPGNTGVLDGTTLPTVWDVEKGINIKWKTRIPGLGHASPVVWGNRVFILTAMAEGDAKVPFVAGAASSSTAGSTNRTYNDAIKHSWRVYALDKQTGKILWERVAHEGVPRAGRHMNQSQADQTPATDGTHLIAWFGAEGMYCYDFDGKLLWKKDLSMLRSGYLIDPAWGWNMSSSPIIYKNLVITQADQLKDSYIAAYDIKTGKEVWRTARDEDPTWATPLIYEGAQRTELITAGARFTRGYDPATGKELWRLGKHSTYAISTPFASHGLVFMASGSGGTIQPIYAVRPGASGDLTLRMASRPARWSRGAAAAERRSSPAPSPTATCSTTFSVAAFCRPTTCRQANKPTRCASRRRAAPTGRRRWPATARSTSRARTARSSSSKRDRSSSDWR
jgi:outer membrane protein assembly factor BamB